jgi:hypothetical protein
MHDAPIEHAPRKTSAWVTGAAVILALQGINTIFYSGLLPAPAGLEAAITLPLLGSVSLVWLALGILDLAAAAGVLRRDTWGRYLGVVAVVASVIVVILSAGTLGALSALSLVFPLFVLFTLWRRWPPDAARPKPPPTQPPPPSEPPPDL